jgi:hypothetical protein
MTRPPRSCSTCRHFWAVPEDATLRACFSVDPTELPDIIPPDLDLEDLARECQAYEATPCQTS